MSPKELLYIEDALSHEQHMKQCCSNSAENVSDTSLKNMVSGMSRRHQSVFDSIYKLLK